MSKKIVMYDSPEAAQIKIVTGWVSRDGRFWGDDERMARYCGATHRQCENNPDHPIIGVHDYCDLCRAKMAVQAF
ncbi:ead/Ea22-like family protein, partial [Xenorhabdus nematophila]